MIDQRSVKKNVLATIIYFDVLQMSLTAFQIWRFSIDTNRLQGDGPEMQPESVSLLRVLQCLKDLEGRNIVHCIDGIYMLRDRIQEAPKRRALVKYSERKLVMAKHWIAWLRYIPFIRCVMITGGLASKNAKRGSDWDVLIIVASGRIWTARTLFTLVAHILGKRRHGIKEHDRFCLNHFISESALGTKIRGLFSAKEYIFAIPMFGNTIFESFIRNNLWVRSYFPLWSPPRSRHRHCLVRRVRLEYVQRGLEKFFGWDFLERMFCSWQKRKIQNNPKTRLKESFIVANDEALIFLPEPHGSKEFEQFKERVFTFAKH